MSVYLDYNATTPLRKSVLEALSKLWEETGNPSAIHAHGRNIRKHIEDAREAVASSMGCPPESVIFTSGATEANNMIIKGHSAERICVSAIEHPSVPEAARNNGKELYILPALKSGIVDIDALKSYLSETPGKQTLVSVMAVNNETGVIQPFEKIGELCKTHGAEFHCDAVQALGKIDIADIMNAADYVTVSAHKISGPAGVGALIRNRTRSDVVVRSFMHGGSQERGYRGGTENISGIIGFGRAVVDSEAERKELMLQLQEMRDTMEEAMLKACSSIMIAGKESPRTATTSNVMLPGIASQRQLMILDTAGFSVSAGAACSAGLLRPSHVLHAMGYGDNAGCALRISMGYLTTRDDITRFTAVWADMAAKLYK